MWFCGEHTISGLEASATPFCMVGCPYGLRPGPSLHLVLCLLNTQALGVLDESGKY